MLSEKVNLDMWVRCYSEVQYERTTQTLQQLGKELASPDSEILCNCWQQYLVLILAQVVHGTPTTNHTIGAAKCHEADGARLGQ